MQGHSGEYRGMQGIQENMGNTGKSGEYREINENLGGIIPK
jgi:hypothetical protein